jgi:hypothetical protein
MKWQNIVRIAGIGAVVCAYLIYAKVGNDLTALIAAVTAILALVSPEAVDAFPLGPTKE